MFTQVSDKSTQDEIESTGSPDQALRTLPTQSPMDVDEADDDTDSVEYVSPEITASRQNEEEASEDTISPVIQPSRAPVHQDTQQPILDADGIESMLSLLDE
jgi:hypothetical protein